MAVEDEHTPLLAAAAGGPPPEEPIERTSSKDDPNVVDFLPSPDPENPLDWPNAYKWALVALLAFNAFCVTFTCVGVVPVASRIVEDLNPDHRPDKAAAVLLVTIWELGEVVGGLVIGPLSEICGRYLVSNGANLLFIASVAVASLSQSNSLLIATRAFTGMAVCANVLNPAIVGDIFGADQRGAALSMIMVAPLLGGALGPALAGAIAEGFGWRWMLWVCVILMSSCELLILLLFRETYKVVILRRKAARLSQETGNLALRTPYDDPSNKQSAFRRLVTTMLRPFPVLCGSPVLIAATLYGSTTFTFFYILSTTFPDILTKTYHLTPAQTGLAFITFSIGSTFAVIICNLTLDRLYIYLRDRDHHKHPAPPPPTNPSSASASTTTQTPTRHGKPEHRLPLTLLCAVFLPLTILLYGLLSTPPLPSKSMPLLLLVVGCQGFFLLLGFLPITAYVVDATGVYAASAMTGLIVVRCLFGTFLPLAVEPLRRSWVGPKGAWGVLAGVCWIMGVVPVLLVWRGERWRRGGRFTRGEGG